MTVTTRARLLVEGAVQGVGYRAFVKQVARNLRIKGCAKNLDDGTVEAYCEAPSPEALDTLLRKIDVKGDPENPFSVQVESIQVTREGQGGFRPQANAFRTFWIDYEAKLSLAEQEMIEKTEIAGLMLLGVGKDVQSVDKAVQGVDKAVRGVDRTLHEFKDESKASFEKLGQGIGGVDKTLTEFKNESKTSFGKLGQTLTGFKDQTIGNFSTLDTKYGTVSGSLDKINANLEALNHTLRKIAAKILQA